MNYRGSTAKPGVSLSFTARYKSEEATTPTGSFIFTSGKLFKLQSDTLDWLVVTAGDTTYIQGTASIRGDGVYPFRVTIRDGAAAGSPDHLLLEECACTTFAETGPIIYRASSEVGGQIQIQALGRSRALGITLRRPDWPHVEREVPRRCAPLEIERYLAQHAGWRSFVLHEGRGGCAGLRPRAITRDLAWRISVPPLWLRGSQAVRMVRRGHRPPVRVDRMGGGPVRSRTSAISEARGRTT